MGGGRFKKMIPFTQSTANTARGFSKKRFQRPAQTPSRELVTENILLSGLSEKQQQALLSSLYRFSKKNLKDVSFQYLDQRMRNYKILTLLGHQGHLTGFSFSQIYFFSFLRIPVFHCGATVVSKQWRGRGAAGVVIHSLYRFVVKTGLINRWRMLFFGVGLTAKCSSPVSFLKLRKLTGFMICPQVNKEGGLSWLSRTRLSRALSCFFSHKLTKGQRVCRDFILRGVNQEGGFQLDEEKYLFPHLKDQVTVCFFKKHIFPYNELLVLAWFHPLFLYWPLNPFKKGRPG